ncbi:MAG: hypothetical protein AAF928_13860 [Myxococcota bacterium]
MANAMRRAALVAALSTPLGCTSSVGLSPEAAVEQTPSRPTGYPQPIHLVPLLTLQNERIVETADLIARTGNASELTTASERLVAIAAYVGRAEWREAYRPWLAARLTRNAPMGAGRIDARVADTQRRHLVRVYDAMKRLVGAGRDGSTPEVLLDHGRDVLDPEGPTRSDAHRRLAAGLLVKAGVLEARSPSGRAAAGPYPAGATPGAMAVGRFGGATQAPRVLQGQLVDAGTVVSSLNGAFVTCYRQSLAAQGRFGAWVTIYASVDSGGRIGQVQGRAEASVPPALVQCLEAVVRQAQFRPPRSGTAMVEIPLAFTPPA